MKFVKSPAAPGFFFLAVVLRRGLPPAKFLRARVFTVPMQRCRLSSTAISTPVIVDIDAGDDRARF
jgi:hypothetical protein